MFPRKVECKFFMTHKSCKWGDKCRYSHITPLGPLGLKGLKGMHSSKNVAAASSDPYLDRKSKQTLWHMREDTYLDSVHKKRRFVSIICGGGYSDTLDLLKDLSKSADTDLSRGEVCRNYSFSHYFSLYECL